MIRAFAVKGLIFLVPLSENNIKCENECCMQFHFDANQSHFHKNEKTFLKFEHSKALDGRGYCETTLF